MAELFCGNCNFQVTEIMNYCPSCGSQLGGMKAKLSGIKRKMEYQIKNKVDGLKSNLDTRISDYLLKVDNDPDFKLAGRNVSDQKKQTIRKALLNFQSKVQTDNHNDEEFEEWLADLELRIEEENCIICFQKWIALEEEILICKSCQSGGHKSHIISWVKQHKLCPLCREELYERDLLKVTQK